LKDKIRALIRDTDSNAWILSNEEILFYAELEGNVSDGTNIYRQAARCAQEAATELGRQASLGGVIKATEQFDMMSKRAAELLARASLSGLAPYAGGISQSDKQGVEIDADRTRPAFTRDKFEDSSVGHRSLTDISA
jgi:hypothetical protein